MAERDKNEKGKLLIGIEYDGRIHADFEIRPLLVRDTIEAYSDALDDAGAPKNDALFGVHLIARQIVRLGDIPRDRITVELLMSMYDEDMTEIREARERMMNRIRSFRSERDAGAQTGAGAS